MSKTDTMAKLPGLFQRGGVWTLRVMIPLDLQGAYQGRSKLVESLQTTDSAEAKVKGTLRRGHWLSAFEQKRRELNPRRIDRITPELSGALAERVAAALMRNDDLVRSDPAAAALFLNALRSVRPASKLRIPGGALPPSPVSLEAAGGPLEGLSEELATKLAQVNAGMDQRSAVLMATQRVAAVLPLAQAEARRMGLQFDEKTPGALDALRESLKAYRKALQAISARDRGEVIDTLAVQRRPASPATTVTRLRDVLPQWKASKVRKPQTVQAAEKALALYEECTGDPPIASLARAYARRAHAGLPLGGWRDSEDREGPLRLHQGLPELRLARAGAAAAQPLGGPVHRVLHDEPSASVDHRAAQGVLLAASARGIRVTD